MARKGAATLYALAKGQRHPLRPPKPEGAQSDPRADFIPVGRRGVQHHAKGKPGMKGHAGDEAAHSRLAAEVAGGLRRMSFKEVRAHQPPKKKGRTPHSGAE